MLQFIKDHTIALTSLSIVFAILLIPFTIYYYVVTHDFSYHITCSDGISIPNVAYYESYGIIEVYNEEGMRMIIMGNRCTLIKN